MSINPLNNISRVYLEQVASVEEGMTMKDFKQQRSRQKQKEKRAAEKTSPTRRAGIHADKASPERAARHRANVDPDFEGNDERNYPGGKLNPKKVRKAKALGELGESSVPGKPAERLGAVTAIPKSEQDAARERILAKTKAKREKMQEERDDEPGEGTRQKYGDMRGLDRSGAPTSFGGKWQSKERKEAGAAALAKLRKEALDPVGQEDADIDNDGDTDKTDKYLHNRRKAIGKAIAKKRGKTVKEGFSNWRQDLAEVMTDEIESKPIKEKKIKNKVKINPSLGEAVEKIGGTLLEMVEIDNVNFSGIFDEMSESEIFFLNDSLIESVVEEFFFECVEDGYDSLEVQESLIESLEIYSAILNEAKVTLGHDTKIKSDRLEKVKTAVKKVGGAVARGAGYATGAAVRGAKAVGREFKKGYDSGRGGSSSSGSESQAQPSSSSNSSSGSEKRPGLLSRIGSKLKSGLKKAIASGARSVSRGARNVARKMEGGETKKVETPKAESKPKVETPKAPVPKAESKPKAKPKVSTKKKKTSNLDNLLASIRNEEIEISEVVYGGKKEEPKDTRYTVTKADKTANTLAYQKYKAGDKRYKAADHLGEETIDEKTLTKMEMKKREEIVKSMKDRAADFEKRYPGRGEEVMYATATKIAKKMVEQMMPQPTNTIDSSIDKKKEMMDKQKIANMKMLQQKQQMLQKQKLQMQKSGKLPLEAD